MFHSLIKLPTRSTVSQNENQNAVVQELDSYADVAPKCQWCHPVQRKEVRGAGEREGKSMEITFQNPYIFSATTPHLNPHPVQDHTVLAMIQECYQVGHVGPLGQIKPQLSKIGSWI